MNNGLRRIYEHLEMLSAVLLVAWIDGFTVFHNAGGLIHLLLVCAVISLILHRWANQQLGCKR
jgi:Family of unknown function (DUF5670)